MDDETDDCRLTLASLPFLGVAIAILMMALGAKFILSLARPNSRAQE